MVDPFSALFFALVAARLLGLAVGIAHHSGQAASLGGAEPALRLRR
jgi:hypothetical protein